MNDDRTAAFPSRAHSGVGFFKIVASGRRTARRGGDGRGAVEFVQALDHNTAAASLLGAAVGDRRSRVQDT
jgi:hypothetical protein